jgi:hypothetical protein
MDDDAIAIGDGYMTRAQAERMAEDPLRASDGSTGVRIAGYPVDRMVSHACHAVGGAHDDTTR